MIRIGYYGATSLNNVIEYIIPESKATSNPQWICLFSDLYSDNFNTDVINIYPGDPLIITPPENYKTNTFSLRNTYKSIPNVDLPTAGYVILGETTWAVSDTTELLSLFLSQQSTTSPVNNRDTVWQFITDTGSWNVWILTYAASQILITIPSSTTGQPTTIQTISNHGLLENDICVIYNITGVSSINDTFIITNVTPNTFQIGLSTFEQGTGGNILVYRSVRFNTTFDRDVGEPPGNWIQDDLAYVDNGDILNAWTVYQWVNNSWISFRQQQYKVDSNLIDNSYLFNIDTHQKLSTINYYDPISGRIPGRADVDIRYKTDYDPAKYNNGNTSNLINVTEAWGDAQLGMVWWDLSAVRYIDSTIGDDRYNSKHWGQLASGTSVNIYEWIKSSIPPTSWNTYVSSGVSITANGISFIPSGTVLNESDPNWSQVIEYDNNLTSTTYYYFWVCNSDMSPQAPWRTMTTGSIASLIVNPNLDINPWFSAISSQSIIIGNYQQYLSDNSVSQRITYSVSKNDSNIYSDWDFIREGDGNSPINQTVWTKLVNSLTTFDGLGNDVPDYKLSNLQKYGNFIRPRQSWFRDRSLASYEFVNTFNNMIASNTTPMVSDQTMAGWLSYFSLSEPIPPQLENWDYLVSNLTDRDALIGTISINQIVVVEPLTSTNNLWTMWKYVGIPTNWLLIRQQDYNTNNCWIYVDWYAFGYDSSTVINSTVDNIDELYSIVNPTIGLTIKVLNNGNNQWQLYVYNTSWVLIGQQNGSIEILSSSYDWVSSYGGFDGQMFDSSGFDKTNSIEFFNIINGIYNCIYATSNNVNINKLFFSIINYVISEQEYVDWLVKTSNIVLKGFNQSLSQSDILLPDLTSSILGFINEAKPYHTKIRKFVTGKSSLDISNFAATDFDLPPGYLNTTMTNVPVINGISINSSYAQGIDNVIIESSSVQQTQLDQILNNTFASWYNNYINNPNLIRTLKIQLVFDRISTPFLMQAWGYNWDISGFDECYNQNFGAITRIINHYQPTAGMIPNIIEDLMSGVNYKGTQLSALGFNETDSIEDYLDQIIDGGQTPVYDCAIGDGNITEFSIITTDISNPNDAIIWSDNKLRTYGVDWIIPTYAETVSVINGGSGYSVGDQLDLIAGTGLAATRLVVTSVNHGTITSVNILGKGSYTSVTLPPYDVQYPIRYQGFGNNATIHINWHCETIKFTSAPASSLTPNIYVLYIGKTFEKAPDNGEIDGFNFIQPYIDDNHPEELYPFKLTDSLSMNIISNRAGGRPLVTNRVYYTDGIADQFDLLIQPQNNSSVIAYLNGNLLTYGLLNDFVINYVTNKMIFITPPAAGILQIICTGTGGSSRSINGAYVVEPGEGYSPGDQITLDKTYTIAPVTLTVNSVTAVSMNIISGGNGYITGDTLFFNISDGEYYNDNELIITVTSVNASGNILDAAISSHGILTTLPTTNSWTLQRSSTTISSANISPIWGVYNVSVVNSGIYVRLPNQPLSQLYASPARGTGSTWNLEFSSDIANYHFTGDGSNVDFIIPNSTFDSPQGINVIVDGVYNSWTRLSNGIRLNSTPAYGSSIVISTYENLEFSQLIETIITITDPSVSTYALLQTSSTTNPTYVSTLVRKNGKLMNPPIMEEIIGTGYSVLYSITIDLSSALAVYVYIDDTLKQNNTDYQISNTTITFTETVSVDSNIVIVKIDNSTEYTLVGSNIIFNLSNISSGDIISVITTSQDIDYEYHTDEFTSATTGKYVLSTNPWDISTVQVWINNQLQIPTVNYTIEQLSADIGFNNSGWDSYYWDISYPAQTTINCPSFSQGNLQLLSSNINISANSVIINYMSSRPAAASIAWKTISTTNKTVSIALDSNRTTSILSNIYVNSSTIEIEDYSIISLPNKFNSSYVYVDNELIGFTSIKLSPTLAYPNRAFLNGLQRNLMGTSGNPNSQYDVIFYNGDNLTVNFPIEATNFSNVTTVWINDVIQIRKRDMINNKYDYDIIGEYVVFVTAPAIGYKNIKVTAWNINFINNTVSHISGSTIIDAGQSVIMPAGYNWEAASNGLQYSRSDQARFLLSHSY